MGSMHTPQVYYWSQATTQGTSHVASHLGCPTIFIDRTTPPPTAPYAILTPTYAGHPQRGGYLPSAVKHWLKHRAAQRYLVGVIGTGDINWGEEFCAAADEISQAHEVPVLHRIDRWGNEDDYTTINQGLDKHWAELCRQRIATLKAHQAKLNNEAESW